MASAIGLARQNLWQMMLAEPGLAAGVPSFGWPDRPKTFAIALMGVLTPAETVVLIGPQSPNDERFGLEVLIKFHDPSAPEDRRPEIDRQCWDAAEVIRSMVRNNRTLKLPGQTAGPGAVVTANVSAQESEGTGRPEVDTGQPAGGQMCVIKTTIACHARAT